MKDKIRTSLTLGFLFSLCPKVLAAPPFEVLSWRGTGCPAGSTSTVVSPDGQSISLLFDKFTAQVPQFSGNNDNDDQTSENESRDSKENARLDHKVCVIQLRANVPAKQKVTGLEFLVDYRGYTHTEKGTHVAFTSTFVNRKGLGPDDNERKVLVHKKWNNETEKSWTLSKVTKVPFDSKCSGSAENHIQFVFKNVLVARMRPQIPVTQGQVMGQLTLDTKDILGKINVKLNTKPCK